MNPKAALARLKKRAELARAPATPIGTARLQKLKLEILRLEHECEAARLDAEIRAGRLLTVDDAKQLFCLPLQTMRDALATLPKRFAVRLHGASPKVIETALADECDRIVALARKAVEL